jgi:NAD(P)H-dependent FMN reductase
VSVSLVPAVPPSAALKNAIDFLFHEWNNKAAGFGGCGGAGGVRAVENLRLAKKFST